MNTNNLYIIIQCFSLIFFLSGCTCSNQPSTMDVSAVITGGDVNTTVTLTAPKDCNTYKINDLICLTIELISDHSVIINTGDVSIFEYHDKQWQQLEDGNIDPPLTYIITPSDSIILRSVLFFTQPRFESRSESVYLRFIVRGNLYDNDVIGDEIIAYTDVILKP